MQQGRSLSTGYVYLDDAENIDFFKHEFVFMYQGCVGTFASAVFVDTIWLLWSLLLHILIVI